MDNLEKLLENRDHYSKFLNGKSGYLANGDFIEYFDDFVQINGERLDKYIECPICHTTMRSISNTHLWGSHRLTTEKFKQLYPDFERSSPFSRYLKEVYSRGRTYHEMLGDEKTNELKKRRQEGASNQMTDEMQRQIRHDKITGIKRDQSSIEKMLETRDGDLDLGYREKALSYYGEECSWCGTTENLCVHHKDGNNFGKNNIFTNNDIDNLVVLCRSCHGKVHSQEKNGYWSGKTEIEKGFATILSGLYEAYGLDINDVNFKDTPSRVARAYLEMLQGIDPQKSIDILKQNFPSHYDGMVTISDISCFSMCPHHFLPVKYTASFGYIPSGNVLGLSKIPRFIKMMAQAPVLQEDLTENIVQLFQEYVSPAGCMVVLKGFHMCMGCRGIEMPNTSTITSAFRGNFEQLVVREEFFNLIKSQGF